MKESVQEWVTVEFTEPGEVLQPEEDWIDLGDCTSMAGVDQIPWFAVSANAKLTLITETAKNREGPWETVVGEVTSAGDPDEEYAFHWIVGRGTDVAATHRIERFGRWRIKFERTGGDPEVDPISGEMCFRRSAVMK